MILCEAVVLVGRGANWKFFAIGGRYGTEEQRFCLIARSASKIQLDKLGKFRLKAQNVSDAALRHSKSCDAFLTLPITQRLQILVGHFWLLTIRILRQSPLNLFNNIHQPRMLFLHWAI